MTSPNGPTNIDESRIYALERPHSNLVIQYFLWSLGTVILFPVVFPVYLCRYYTLRYRFDSEGISMRWGFLFHREINLTYARIQDIHVTRGLVERWLGLATVSIQTASGSASAEMVMNGIEDYEALREFLYRRMQGLRAEPQTAAVAQASGGEALELLRAICDDLSAIRRSLSGRDHV
jgi:uncharacterized membrane protein YdbT with pleckstrin-like domain